ncbi:MAG TPA: riboflavin biosynthesis protein RibF, partial [candidate division Zixibacteria bacterium]|nr:riboflavin biosynthesis protein RibF [candidate division Zixibacteria bacterium]
MTFIRGLQNYHREPGQSTVVTIGTFDGIHRGHQEILRQVQEESRRLGLEPVLITFDPHPRVVVTPENIPLLLTSIEEKEKFIPDFFEGTVLIIEFNESIKELSAEEFIRTILVETVGAKKVIVGYDHAFGKNRSGNIQSLEMYGEKYGYEVDVVGPVLLKNEPVSSSRIRRAIQNNEYHNALELLGHDYAIYGTVERGIGLGRRLGYPTANVRYSIRKLLPAEGVYVCWAQIGDETRDGMMFIGRNHFNPAQRITVEANLFEFDRDIYDQE